MSNNKIMSEFNFKLEDTTTKQKQYPAKKRASAPSAAREKRMENKIYGGIAFDVADGKVYYFED